MLHSTSPITNWAPIVGIWESEANQILYVKQSDARIPFGFGIALSPARLRSGSISTTIDFSNNPHSNEARLIFGYNTLTRDYFSAGIGGYGNAFVIDEFVSSRGWQALNVTGSKESIDETKPHNVVVNIDGQRVTLIVDEIQVVQHKLSRPLPGDQVGLLAVGPGQVSFANTVVNAASPKVFVVMQYGEPYDSIYAEVIFPVCKEMGLNAFRADDIHKPGIILQDIITGIVESEIIIAEITAPNPNVFYELGYSHALTKTTILLAERNKELPFDIKSYRCIFYDNTIRGKRDVETTLRKHLENILHD
ncbi:MAG TPA: hypothetical protein VI423_08515 [Paenisporosarcina sp.]|nr:hypothetical protein [Paenisporosarcina sp.]